MTNIIDLNLNELVEKIKKKRNFIVGGYKNIYW